MRCNHVGDCSPKMSLPSFFSRSIVPLIFLGTVFFSQPFFCISLQCKCVIRDQVWSPLVKFPFQEYLAAVIPMMPPPRFTLLPLFGVLLRGSLTLSVLMLCGLFFDLALSPFVLPVFPKPQTRWENLFCDLGCEPFFRGHRPFGPFAFSSSHILARSADCF